MTGREFQRRRKALGKNVSQEVLAEWFGVAQKTISRLENTEGHIKRAYALAMLWTCEHDDVLDVWMHERNARIESARAAGVAAATGYERDAERSSGQAAK